MIDNGLMNIKSALVLCPHTDDEYGCAGTLIRLVRQGIEMHYVAFSRCEESVPDGLPLDTLEKECRASTAAIGFPEQNIRVLNYRVRHFPNSRQEILEDLIKIRNELKPDLVLMPASSDTHQDHSTVYQEGFRAFKHSSILGYELPQNIRTFENTAFVRLSELDLNAKIEALQHYASQGFRRYSQPEFIKSLAVVRGMQCDSDYAEAFELIRMIV